MNWWERNKAGAKPTIGGLLVIAVFLFFAAIDGCGAKH